MFPLSGVLVLPELVGRSSGRSSSSSSCCCCCSSSSSSSKEAVWPLLGIGFEGFSTPANFAREGRTACSLKHEGLGFGFNILDMI